MLWILELVLGDALCFGFVFWFLVWVVGSALICGIGFGRCFVFSGFGRLNS